MRSIPHLWLSASFVLLLSAGHAFADGKMYAEKINTVIPYQRAVILFDKGRETLILQSQYQIPGNSGKHTIGWVVPVPAVPEIGSMKAVDADWLFSNLDYQSHPKVVSWGMIVSLSMFGLGSGFAIIALAASFAPQLIHFKSRLRRLASASAIVVWIVILIGPILIRQGKGDGGVEVLKSGRVGIYDTKVIRSDSPRDLIEWFNSNSFDFDQADEKAIQSYIDRKWCFVVAKVDASVDSANKDAVSNKLLAPLILHFPMQNPVYPSALTATGGHSTEILIYLVSGGPMKTQSPLVPRYRGTPGIDRIHSPLLAIEPDEILAKLPWDIGHLSKFKATLTPAQMERDIEFIPDPEAQPLREQVYRW